MQCSSTPWETDSDVLDDKDLVLKEKDKGHRYSKGYLCPICGEPMTNCAETCIDCLPLQMSNPIIAAERQQRHLERLRDKLKTAPSVQIATILATKLWQGPKRVATIAKRQLLEEIEILLREDPFALDKARREKEAKIE